MPSADTINPAAQQPRSGQGGQAWPQHAPPLACCRRLVLGAVGRRRLLDLLRLKRLLLRPRRLRLLLRLHIPAGAGRGGDVVCARAVGPSAAGLLHTAAAAPVTPLARLPTSASPSHAPPPRPDESPPGFPSSSSRHRARRPACMPECVPQYTACMHMYRHVYPRLTCTAASAPRTWRCAPCHPRSRWACGSGRPAPARLRYRQGQGAVQRQRNG